MFDQLAVTDLALFADGPFATVYRARFADQDVAVKIYKSDSGAPSHAGRATRESTALQRVRNRSVARVLDAGALADGSPYLISTWIDGASLEALLVRGPIAWPDAVRIVAALSDALAEVHAAGIVHRDIKPSNVVVPHDGHPAAVLVDFGHCLVAGDGRLTDTGHVLGSAAYMAPEQCAGLEIDGRADLYALGVVLYRAVTGCLPFDAASGIELMQLHQTAQVIAPRERAPHCNVSRATEDLCLWLLAKDPAARTPSARVLAITIAAVLRDSSLEPSIGAAP